MGIGNGMLVGSGERERGWGVDAPYAPPHPSPPLGNRHSPGPGWLLAPNQTGNQLRAAAR